MNDLRYASRQLLKNPGFIVVSVLALAASTVVCAQEETEHVDRSALRFTTFSGDVHLTK